MNKKLFLILCLILSASQLFAGFSPLGFKKKTLEVSGWFMPIYRLSDFSSLSHELILNSEAGLGYFVTDRVSVGLSLPARVNFLPIVSGEAGLSISGTYFFAPKMSIYPYAGLHITPLYSISTQMPKLLAKARVGVLLGLNDMVALDLGIAPEMDIRLNNKQKWRLRVPLGFFGVRAFF